jgi:cell division topological specificity factor
MNIFDFFRQRRRSNASASIAKDRLQIVLSHERMSRDGEDFLPRLQRDIVAVVARYADIDPDKTVVRLDRGVDVSTLEIEIELPARIRAAVQ